ncbi:hypothetical protein HK096_010844, partial [Nowakowskiella sp. JEL0078]
VNFNDAIDNFRKLKRQREDGTDQNVPTLSPGRHPLSDNENYGKSSGSTFGVDLQPPEFGRNSNESLDFEVLRDEKYEGSLQEDPVMPWHIDEFEKRGSEAS